MTVNKTNAIILAAAGRVGSNFLLSPFQFNYKQWFVLGEFFNPIYWNLYIKMHIINLMCKHKSKAIFDYSEWLEQNDIFLKRNLGLLIQRELSYDKMRDELERFIKPSNESLYTTTIKFINEEVNQNTVAKVFLHNTFVDENSKHDIDVYNILQNCNTLIIPYRRNALLTHISETKGKLSEVWYVTTNGVNLDKLEENRNLKIEWNKKDYLIKFKELNEGNNKVFEIYDKFSKPKCIINFEELHSHLLLKDKLQHIKNIYDKNNININIDLDQKNSTMKQSKDQPLEDYFTNPEEFLKDLPDIPIFLDYEY